MSIQKMFSAIAFSMLIGISLVSIPLDYAHSADSKECPPEFVYDVVFKKCIYDHPSY